MGIMVEIHRGSLCKSSEQGLAQSRCSMMTCEDESHISQCKTRYHFRWDIATRNPQDLEPSSLGFVLSTYPKHLPVHLRRAVCEGPWSGFSNLPIWSAGEWFPPALRFLLPESNLQPVTVHDSLYHLDPAVFLRDTIYTFSFSEEEHRDWYIRAEAIYQPFL